jgi:hypothetical protein
MRRDANLFLALADSRLFIGFAWLHLATRRIPLANTVAAFLHGKQDLAVTAQE